MKSCVGVWDQLGISRITLDLAARSAFSPLGISDAQRSGGHVSREGTDVDSRALVSPPTRIVVAVSPDAKGVEAAKAAERPSAEITTGA